MAARPGIARAQQSDTPRLGGYAAGGFQIGFAPGETSVLPGIFLKGGPTYGALRTAAELSLSIGPSKRDGFAVLAGALLSLGVQSPAMSTKVAWFADAHFGPMFYHREGPGQTEASGLWGGASVGVVAFDSPGHSTGVFAGLTALTPLRAPDRNGAEGPLVIPMFVRAGVTAR